jgi:hypothetical protein
MPLPIVEVVVLYRGLLTCNTLVCFNRLHQYINQVSDLPSVWKAAMKESLGVEVPSEAKGPLQDIHWSIGTK